MAEKPLPSTTEMLRDTHDLEMRVHLKLLQDVVTTLATANAETLRKFSALLEPMIGVFTRTLCQWRQLHQRNLSAIELVAKIRRESVDNRDLERLEKILRG